MADIRNENLPPVQENTEETLKRLEQTKNKIERSSSIIKGVGIALPIVAGLAWYGITGNSGMTELSALAAFPVVTAVVAAHAFVRDAVEHKIDALRKKISGSSLVSSMLGKQKLRLKQEEEHYNYLKHEKKGAYREEVESAKENAEKEKQHQIVFSKAAELAKQEGEEKTVGRLMSTVTKYETGDTFRYIAGSAIQGMYSLFVAPSMIEMISQGSRDPLTMAMSAAAAITIPATAYCVAKTAQSVKRKINADRAFKSLKEYTGERS